MLILVWANTYISGYVMAHNSVGPIPVVKIVQKFLVENCDYEPIRSICVQHVSETVDITVLYCLSI